MFPVDQTLSHLIRMVQVYLGPKCFLWRLFFVNSYCIDLEFLLWFFLKFIFFIDMLLYLIIFVDKFIQNSILLFVLRELRFALDWIQASPKVTDMRVVLSVHLSQLVYSVVD